MNCSRFRFLIQQWFDGQLEPQEEQMLMSHLDACDSCERFRHQIDQVVQSAPEVPLPEECLPGNLEALARRVMQELPQDKPGFMDGIKNMFGGTAGAGAKRERPSQRGKEKAPAGAPAAAAGPTGKDADKNSAFPHVRRSGPAKIDDAEEDMRATSTRLRNISKMVSDDGVDQSQTGFGLGSKFGMDIPNRDAQQADREMTFAESIRKKIGEQMSEPGPEQGGGYPPPTFPGGPGQQTGMPPGMNMPGAGGPPAFGNQQGGFEQPPSTVPPWGEQPQPGAWPQGGQQPGGPPAWQQPAAPSGFAPQPGSPPDWANPQPPSNWGQPATSGAPDWGGASQQTPPPQPATSGAPDWGGASQQTPPPQPATSGAPDWGGAPQQPQTGGAPDWGGAPQQPQTSGAPDWGGAQQPQPQPQPGTPPAWGTPAAQEWGNTSNFAGGPSEVPQAPVWGQPPAPGATDWNNPPTPGTGGPNNWGQPQGAPNAWGNQPGAGGDWGTPDVGGAKPEGWGSSWDAPNEQPPQPGWGSSWDDPSEKAAQQAAQQAQQQAPQPPQPPQPAPPDQAGQPAASGWGPPQPTSNEWGVTAQDAAAPANNWGTPQAGTSWAGGQGQQQPQPGGWGDNGGTAAAGTAPGAWGTPQPASGGWAPTAPDANVGAAGTAPAGWANPAAGAPPAWQSSDNSAPTTILRGDAPMPGAHQQAVPMPAQSPPPPAPAPAAAGAPMEWNPHDEDQIQTGMWQVFAVDDNLGAKGPAAAGSRPQPALPPNVTPLSAADSPVPSNVTQLPSNVTPLQPAAPPQSNTGQQPQPKLSAMGENIMDRLHTILGDGLEGMAAGTQPLPGSTPPPEAPPAPGAPPWGSPPAGQPVPGQPPQGGWAAPDQGASSFGPDDDLPIQEKLRRQQMAAQQGQPDPAAQPAWGAPAAGPQPGNGMQPAWGAQQGNNWGGDQPPAQPAGIPPINQQWETQQIGAVSQEQLAQAAAAAAAAAPPNGGWETPSASAQGGWAPAAEQQVQQGGWNAPSQAVAQAPAGPSAPPVGGLYRNIDNQAINTVFRENLSTKDGIHAAPAAVVSPPQPVAAPAAFAAPVMPTAATAAPGVMAQPQAAAAPAQAPMPAPAATPEPAGLLGRIDDQAIDRIFAENLGIRDSLAASAVRREEFEAEQAAAPPPPMMQPPPGLEGMVPQSQAALAQQAPVPAPAPAPVPAPMAPPPQAPPPFAGMPTNVDQTGGWNIPPQIQQIQQQPVPPVQQQQPAWNIPGPETQQQQQQSGWNIPQQAAPEPAAWTPPPQQPAPEQPAAWTPPPQQPAPEQPTWNAPPQQAVPEQAGWNAQPQQPVAPPQLAPVPPQLPPQAAPQTGGWNPAPAGQPPMDQQPQPGGWGMPQQPAAQPQASAMQAIFSGDMGGGAQPPQLGADGQPLNVARAVEAVREAVVDQASAPDVPKVEGIGRLAKDDQTAEPTSGKIAQIGKFLLDSSDFNKLGNLASTPDLPDAKVRVLTLEAADEINKLLNHIATQPGVVGSVIVGHDGILIASNLPSDVDPESVGIWSLGIYVNTLNSTKKLGHNHLHQLVARSRFGYLVVADFGGGILVTVSNGQETDKLIPLMRSITQLVAQ